MPEHHARSGKNAGCPGEDAEFPEPCVFCGAADTACAFFPLGRGKTRLYRRCRVCGGIFCAGAWLPAFETERSRYLLHRDGSGDGKYVALLNGFVSRSLEIAGCAAPGVCAGKSALDFGCGPYPVLTGILRERGFRAFGVDPLFFPAVFSPEPALTAHERGGFDFLFCHECAEHFHAPRETFREMAEFLRRGGVCAVSTGFLPPSSGTDGGFPPFFRDWWYRMDVTHVSFYTPQAMERAAESAGLRRILPPGASGAETDGPAVFVRE